MCDLCWQPTAMFRCECGLMLCPGCANEHERTHDNKEAAQPEPEILPTAIKTQGGI